MTEKEHLALKEPNYQAQMIASGHQGLELETRIDWTGRDRPENF